MDVIMAHEKALDTVLLPCVLEEMIGLVDILTVCHALFTMLHTRLWHHEHFVRLLNPVFQA